jgi:hypothetical protein
MPRFFLPAATTPEMAEDNYQAFVKAAGLYPALTGRLFSITFMHDRRSVIAEVGKDMGWHEPSGTVLAVIETSGLLYVFTKYRGGVTGRPIMVGPEEVRSRTYFDDFPP